MEGGWVVVRLAVFCMTPFNRRMHVEIHAYKGLLLLLPAFPRNQPTVIQVSVTTSATGNKTNTKRYSKAKIFVHRAFINQLSSLNSHRIAASLSSSFHDASSQSEA